MWADSGEELGHSMETNTEWTSPHKSVYPFNRSRNLRNWLIEI
jgi:hypothetical protein